MALLKITIPERMNETVKEMLDQIVQENCDFESNHRAAAAHMLNEIDRYENPTDYQDEKVTDKPYPPEKDIAINASETPKTTAPRKDWNSRF